MNNGKIYIIGIGPGNPESMTGSAHKALEESKYIAGYTVYCDLIRDHFENKEYIITPMTGEEKRVALAFEKAAEGNVVSIICSGDAGVYGMAGLACAKAAEYKNVSAKVIPGVTAALSGAALLGAPLIHDFCVISLSDRLTPMEIIEKRLRLAAEADMPIVLYNPESKSRSGYLSHACEILLETAEPERVCGIARNIGREGEECEITTLEKLRNIKADMFSTVFIGNSSTRDIGGFMVTARGYKSEQ